MKSLEQIQRRPSVFPKRDITTAATLHAVCNLSNEEIEEAEEQLIKKARAWTPKSTNMWRAEVNGRNVWGMLDPKSGESGEDLLTLFLESEYDLSKLDRL